ncbi:acyl-coenzyme A thioesterase 1-like [Chanos chanos]|uniref:Acyl-coenzyme A thioesterase 1-like n=1 Tax=Chanos chanos TaxID=29144 RepID=A0A6J2V828_CHACN|nr:acyl-coenzyme A thioesterase 1-like [Chanos chanos]
MGFQMIRAFSTFGKIFQRTFATVKMNPLSPAQLRLLPGPSCFFDEPVQVKVNGLSPQQKVELRCKVTDDKGVVYNSSGTYLADHNGEVDVSSQPSLAGSFTGIEPMGLFWSLKPDQQHSKLTKRDVVSPIQFLFEVVSGHGEVLAQEINTRRFMADGVRRIPVKDGRIRGCLFLPPGPGPFPAVIDIYTLGGGISEVRASLLANKGFVVLALAYYGYQDLPKAVSKLDLEYFEEAVTFLQKLPEVKGPGIGVLSISKSGELSLAMASFLSGISAVACINSCSANVLFPLHYKDMVIPPLPSDIKRAFITESGIVDIRDTLADAAAEENLACVIPVERTNCNILFLVSEDDRNWNSLYHAQLATKRLRDHGKANYEIITYPKAGHFLEVPYMPHCPSGFHGAVGKVVNFGGDPKTHAEAQIDAWKKIQEFFKKNLGCVSDSYQSML